MKRSREIIVSENSPRFTVDTTQVFLVHPDPNDPDIIVLRHKLVDDLRCTVTNPDLLYTEGEAMPQTQFDFESRMAKDRAAMAEAKHLVLPPLRMTPESAEWDWKHSYLALEQVSAAMARRPPLSVRQLSFLSDGRLTHKTLADSRVQEAIDDNYESAYEQYCSLAANVNVTKGNLISPKAHSEVRLRSVKMDRYTIKTATAGAGGGKDGNAEPDVASK